MVFGGLFVRVFWGELTLTSFALSGASDEEPKKRIHDPVRRCGRRDHIRRERGKRGLITPVIKTTLPVLETHAAHFTERVINFVLAAQENKTRAVDPGTQLWNRVIAISGSELFLLLHKNFSRSLLVVV